MFPKMLGSHGELKFLWGKKAMENIMELMKGKDCSLDIL